MKKLILILALIIFSGDLLAQVSSVGTQGSVTNVPHTFARRDANGDFDVGTLNAEDGYKINGVALASLDNVLWVDISFSAVTSTGSINRPYSTISDAITASTSGDLILVVPGVYSEHLAITETNISIIGVGGAGVTFLEALVSDGTGIALVDSTLIKGFTLTSNAAGAIIQLNSGEIGVQILDNVINSTGSATFGIVGGAAGSDELLVQGNIFRTNAGDGAIWLEKNHTNTVIDDNYFYGADSTSGYAIQTAGINVARFSDNVIEGYASGIFPHTATTTSSGTYNIVIEGNSIKHCAKAIRLGHSSQTVNMDSVFVFNNTLYENNIGIYIDDDATILANTFAIVDNRMLENTTNYNNNHSSLVPYALSNFIGADFTSTGTVQGATITDGTVSFTSGSGTGITTLSMDNQLTNSLTTGTSPFAITSTTINTNLNADLLDGNHSTAFMGATKEVDLVAGVGLSGGQDDVMPGADADVTITFDATELDAITWSDNANVSNVWTFNVSGTDHTMTAGNGLMTFSHNIAGVDLGLSGKISATTYGSDGSVSDAELLYVDATSSIQTQLDGKQPLEATLTDIADGTINENLINTANPWAANEIVSTVIHESELSALETDPNVDTEAEIEAITGAFFGTSKVVTSGYIWVADGVDFESVIMSGEATIASGGAITLNNDALDDQYYDSESDLTTLLDDNYEAELNNSAGLATALSDEVGTDKSVFSDSPTFTTKITAPPIFIVEQAADLASIAGQGQFWVKDDAPNIPMFTDDADTEWKIQVGTSGYGEMYFNANGNAAVIETASTPIALRQFTTGSLSNFTYTVGSTGAVTAYYDRGANVGVHDDTHGLSTGNVISIRGTTNYNGIFSVTVVDADSFYIADTWATDEGASDWDQGDYLTVTNTGTYKLDWDISAAESGGAGSTLTYAVYINATIENKSRIQRKFANNDVGAFGGHAILSLSAGDIIFLTASSSGTNDMTHSYGALALEGI